MSEDLFERLMREYREKFGEDFPVFLCMGMSDEEIIAEIESCLKSGKKLEPEGELIY